VRSKERTVGLPRYSARGVFARRHLETGA
jgi:hypothetical protein